MFPPVAGDNDIYLCLFYGLSEDEIWQKTSSVEWKLVYRQGFLLLATLWQLVENNKENICYKNREGVYINDKCNQLHMK